MERYVEVRSVSKGFTHNKETQTVLSDLSLTFGEGDVAAICGTSGIGKSTVLRLIAGLEKPDEGQIVVDGFAPQALYPRIGYVEQSYSKSLFPWMTIRSNVAMSLLNSGLSAQRRREIAMERLVEVGLESSAGKRPWQLSGGMQQRVAIARALAPRPRLLCLDEPFVSLDVQTRHDLQDLVLQLTEKHSVTTILVTHDPDEAIYMSDYVYVFKSAGVAPVRLPVNLPRPRVRDQTRFSADFLSLRSELEAHMRRS